jgi:hypothetical protein
MFPELACLAVASQPVQLSSRLFISPLGSLWSQKAPTQNSEEPLISIQQIHPFRIAESLILQFAGNPLNPYHSPCKMRPEYQDPRGWSFEWGNNRPS